MSAADVLLVTVSGSALAGGVVALVVGLRGTYEDPDGPARPDGFLTRRLRGAAGATVTERQRRTRRIRMSAACVVGALAWLFTGWLVVGLLVVTAFVGLPWLLEPTRSDHTVVDRLDALAEWTRRIADLIELGAGLENAIVTSRATCPAPIRDEVGDLVSRLQSRWRPDEALRVFAAALGDATADKIAAALILRAEDRGPGLAVALKDLAGTVREEVRQRRSIEADRAGARTAVRWITYLTLAVAALVVVFNRAYAKPYGSLPGQLVLLLLALGYVATLLWMRSIAAHRPAPRFLAADPRSAVTVAERQVDVVRQARNGAAPASSMTGRQGAGDAW